MGHATTGVDSRPASVSIEARVLDLDVARDVFGVPRDVGQPLSGDTDRLVLANQHSRALIQIDHGVLTGLTAIDRFPRLRQDAIERERRPSIGVDVQQTGGPCQQRPGLTPPSAASTTVVASASSPVCDPADPTFVCANACDAQFAAECAAPHLSRPLCINDCVSNTTFFNYYKPCGTEWGAYVACVTALPPPAANWDCSFPGFPPQPLSPNCDAELNAAFACLYY